MSDRPDYTLPVSIEAVVIATLPVDIKAQSIGNLAVDIKAQTVGNIGIDIKAATAKVGITVNVADVTGNLPIDIKAQTVGNISVDIKAATAKVGITLNVADITGNLPIDIKAQTVGNIGIDIKAQTVGNVGVDIKAATATINIATSGGANIIIDKLTQAAYTCRGVTLQNDNGVTAPNNPPDSSGLTYRSKWFPRGARGFIFAIHLYCKVPVAGTITLGYTLAPGMGELGTVTITAGTDWAWCDAYPCRMWPYDSLFIYVKSVTGNAAYGREATDPLADAHISSDSGVTWSPVSYRLFIRVSYRFQTVGDLPVSGTINTIEIPHVSDERLFVSNDNLGLAPETTLKTVYGSGEVEYLRFRVMTKADSHLTTIRIYCDGKLVFTESFFGSNDYGHTPSSPLISLLKYAADGTCVVLLGLHFSFLRELKIAMYAVNTPGQWVEVEGVVNLIK